MRREGTSVRMVYSEALMDHFHRPRRVGRFDSADADVGKGEAGSVATGGVINLQLKLDSSSRSSVGDACFLAYGPPPLIAAGSWLAESVCGKSLEQIEAITHHDVVKALELPAARVHCAFLAEDALRAAIQDLRNKERAYI